MTLIFIHITQLTLSCFTNWKAPPYMSIGGQNLNISLINWYLTAYIYLNNIKIISYFCAICITIKWQAWDTVWIKKEYEKVTFRLSYVLFRKEQIFVLLTSLTWLCYQQKMVDLGRQFMNKGRRRCQQREVFCNSELYFCLCLRWLLKYLLEF